MSNPTRLTRQGHLTKGKISSGLRPGRCRLPTDGCSGPIRGFTPLLDAVEKVLGSLSGVPFFADALHTQTDHTRRITARGAHLLLQAKGNQPTLFA